MLHIVDDLYLYRTITEGRPGTAMPAWGDLPADQVGAIIDHLRSWQAGTEVRLEKAPPRGNYDLGEIRFNLACVQRHGENGLGGVGPQLSNPFS